MPLRVPYPCLIFLAWSLFLAITSSNCSDVFLSSFSFRRQSCSCRWIFSFKESLSWLSCSSFRFVLLTISSRLLISVINYLTRHLLKSGLFQPSPTCSTTSYSMIPSTALPSPRILVHLQLLRAASVVFSCLHQFCCATPSDFWSFYSMEYFSSGCSVFLLELLVFAF